MGLKKQTKKNKNLYILTSIAAALPCQLQALGDHITTNCSLLEADRELRSDYQALLSAFPVLSAALDWGGGEQMQLALRHELRGGASCQSCIWVDPINIVRISPVLVKLPHRPINEQQPAIG